MGQLEAVELDKKAGRGSPDHVPDPASALVVRQRAGRTDAGHRRHVRLPDQRSRNCLVSGREDGEGSLRPQEPASAAHSGSPVLIDGRIYITNEDRLTSVLKTGPVFEVMAENDLDDYTLSSPAIAEG
jgi:hypothetical protein